MDAYDEGAGARAGEPGTQQPGPDQPAPAAPPIDADRLRPEGADVPDDPRAVGATSRDHPRAAAARPPAHPRPAGIAALSFRYQVLAALALAVVAVVTCAHLAMVFLHVAPANTMTKQHGRAVDDWIYPEFEQNWKLFAPNPLQQNISVQVRADVRTADGATWTSRWYDLSAQDGATIDGNLLPSHTQQNELRRAWDFYVASHDARNRPVGLRGELSERYVRRIALMRVEQRKPGGRSAVIERVQVRSRTTNVRPPAWSGEKADTRPVFRELPWWSVTPVDIPLHTATKAGAR